MLKFKVTCLVNLIHWSAMLWRARKRNWLALSRPLSSMCLWTIFRITFSNSLPIEDKRLIGCKFWGNFWFLPGSGNGIACTSFKDSGKWDSRRQRINKCVRCTSGLLGRCLRHSFGVPSSPQDFLNSNEFANWSVSQCLTLHKGFSSLRELGLESPPAAHRFRHTGQEMWTGFLNNPQSRWFSCSGDIVQCWMSVIPLWRPLYNVCGTWPLYFTCTLRVTCEHQRARLQKTPLDLLHLFIYDSTSRYYSLWLQCVMTILCRVSERSFDRFCYLLCLLLNADSWLTNWMLTAN
jgi:hypothetical protein